MRSEFGINEAMGRSRVDKSGEQNRVVGNVRG